MQTLEVFIHHELGIPKKMVSTVTKFYKKEQLQKHEFLVNKGRHCHKLCFVERGYFRFFNQNDKKVITHWIFGKGQLVTDIAGFYLKEPAKWNIQALTNITMYSITYSDFQELRTDMPAWDAYEKLMIVKLMSGLENRVYALLSMSAEERYQYLFHTDNEIFNALPLHYIASMLGMTPETLSRIRAKDLH